MNPKKKAYTERMELFCRAYVLHGNASQAARDAGYSLLRAGSTGRDMMKKKAVIDRINELKSQRNERLELNADDVLREIYKIATTDLKAFYDSNGSLLPIHQWPEGAGKLVASVEVDEIFDGFGKEREHIGYTKKLKLWDKLKALEMLAKHLKLLTEKHEHSGSMTLEQIIAESRKED